MLLENERKKVVHLKQTILLEKERKKEILLIRSLMRRNDSLYYELRNLGIAVEPLAPGHIWGPAKLFSVDEIYTKAYGEKITACLELEKNENKKYEHIESYFDLRDKNAVLAHRYNENKTAVKNCRSEMKNAELIFVKNIKNKVIVRLKKELE